MTVVPFETRVQLVRNRAAARMADDEYRSISVKGFDLLDHPIELLLETVDGVFIAGFRVARVGECVKRYVGAQFFCASLPKVHVGLRGLESAEENNVDAHLLLPFSEVSP